MKAYEEAEKVLNGIVDGSVSVLLSIVICSSFDFCL